MKTQTKPVDIAAIRIDGGTQIRAQLDTTVVSDYADAISEGAEFPPVTIFYDGLDYWLADGFHRFHAYSRAKKATIPAEIRAGDQRSAWLHALGANAENGLRRSNEDKHKAVHAALEDGELSKWSNREIARQCRVSGFMVRSLKDRLTAINRSEEFEEEAKEERTYTTKHGTQATMNTAKIGKSPHSDAPVGNCRLTPLPDEEGAPDQDEFDSVAAAEKAEQMAMRLLLASDEPMADLAAKYEQALIQVDRLNARIVGLQNQSMHQIKTIKSLQNKIKKMEQPA